MLQIKLLSINQAVFFGSRSSGNALSVELRSSRLGQFSPSFAIRETKRGFAFKKIIVLELTGGFIHRDQQVPFELAIELTSF